MVNIKVKHIYHLWSVINLDQGGQHMSRELPSVLQYNNIDVGLRTSLQKIASSVTRDKRYGSYVARHGHRSLQPTLERTRTWFREANSYTWKLRLFQHHAGIFTIATSFSSYYQKFKYIQQLLFIIFSIVDEKVYSLTNTLQGFNLNTRWRSKNGASWS